MKNYKLNITGLFLVSLMLFTSLFSVPSVFAQEDSLLTPSVLHYSFDDGTATDLSGNDNDGVISGAVETTGVKLSGMHFDGNDNISVANDSSLNFGTGDFSLSFWIKKDLSSNNSEIILEKIDPNRKSGYGLSVHFNKSIFLSLGSSTGIHAYCCGGELSDNKWHHIALTVENNSYLTVYRDGVYCRRYSIKSFNLSNNSDLKIGTGTMRPDLNGALDEMEIFDKELTSSEVKNLYYKNYPETEFRLQSKTVSIGDTLTSVLSTFGSPARIDTSEYGFNWYIYNQNYNNYVQIGIQNNVVVALCSNAPNLKYKNLEIGTPKTVVRDTLGSPDTSPIRIGGNSANIDYFTTNNLHTRTYYDIYSDDTLSAVLIINKDIYLSGRTYSQAVVEGFEKPIHR